MNEDIHEELDSIDDKLSIQLSGDSPIEAIDRLAMVSTYHSRISHLLPIAKRELRLQKIGELRDQIVTIAKQNFLSAKAQNALVESICIEQQFLVERMERLQSSCVHDIDASRSILSYLKEEMNNNIHTTH